MRLGQLAGLIGAAVTVIGVATVANAATVFSTFGPGQSFDLLGVLISGPTSAVLFGSQYADGFTSPGYFNVDQIDVALANLSGTNSANVSLWTDVADVPGSELGSWTLNGQPPFGSFQVTAISGITGISLTKKSKYFLAVSPGAADTYDQWMGNNVGAQGPIAHMIGGGGWELSTEVGDGVTG